MAEPYGPDYLRRKLETVGANVRITARRGQDYLLEEQP